MTRALDPDYEDTTRRGAANRVVFMELSTVEAPDPANAVLRRVQVGFQDKVDFGADLSDLGDFTFTNVSPTLVPGTGVRLAPAVCPTCPAPEGANCSMVADYHWPSGIDVSRILTQYKVRRENIEVATPSAMPHAYVRHGFPDAVFVARIVNPVGSTYPTVENQDSTSTAGVDFSQHADAHPMVLDLAGRRGLVGYTYPDISPIVDFGILSLGSTPPTSPSSTSTVLGRLWRHPDNHGGPSAPCGGCACGGPFPCLPQVEYCGPLMWEGMAAMLSDEVCVLNLPAGVGFDLTTRGVFPIMDSGIVGPIGSGSHFFGGSAANNPGNPLYATADGQTLHAYANGIPYPYQRVQLRDNFGGGWGSVFLDPTGPDGVWGGDCYRLEYQQGLDRIAGYSDADVRLTWPTGEEFIGLGRQGLAYEEIREDGDLRASGVEITLPAIDLTSAASVVSALRHTRHRGGVVRIWAGHYDHETGELIDTPQLEGWYYASGGFDVDWVPATKDAPGGARLTVRVDSRVGGLDRRTGITMSLEGHQRYYPGDTFYAGRKDLIGIEIPWGQK